MRQGANMSTQKQPESSKQPEEYQRKPWQRPQLQRLNLSLDTAMTAGSTDDTVTFRP
jgi:hypothetical protein